MLIFMQGWEKKKKKEYLLSRPSVQESGIYSFQDDFIWHWPSSLSQEKGTETTSARRQKCILKRPWRHCKVSSPFKGHCEDSVVLGKVTSNHSTTEITTNTTHSYRTCPALSYTSKKKQKTVQKKNEQEHEAVFPDSYIPEVKTNSLYLAYPKSRRGGHLSTAQGLGKSFLTSKALTLGKCTKLASWELKLDPFKPQKDRSFFTESSRGPAPRVPLTNSFGQLFWISLLLDNVDFLACK